MCSTLLVFTVLVDLAVGSKMARDGRLRLERRADQVSRVAFLLIYMLVAGWALQLEVGWS